MNPFQQELVEIENKRKEIENDPTIKEKEVTLALWLRDRIDHYERIIKLRKDYLRENNK